MEIFLSASSRQECFPVDDISEVASTRRAGTQMAGRLGFDEETAGRVALVITEAATNILKHAERGEILLRPIFSNDVGGMEILALDSGPGMKSTSDSRQDGYSTTGTYGVGLGSMERLSDEIDIYAPLGKGTAICMRIWAKPVPPASDWLIGSVNLPLRGEPVCGDAWAVSMDKTRGLVLVADGLGHGVQAAEAAEAATRVLAQHPEYPASTLLEFAHDALRSTRGAAVAVASIDIDDQELRFAGVGNVACYVHSNGGRRQMVSHNGIVGSNVQKIQEYTAALDDSASIVLHSDGLASRWDLEQYPALLAQHPSIIAGVLYRDYSRKRDDVTVLVIRYNG